MRIFPSQIPFDFILVDGDLINNRQHEEGMYYFCTTFQDGSLDTFGWVVGKELHKILFISGDPKDTLYFEWEGQWGYLCNGIAQYYVHGHEEGNGTNKPMELDEVLQETFSYAKNSFDRKCKDYFEDQMQLAALEEIERKKQLRRRLAVYISGAIFIASIIYTFFN